MRPPPRAAIALSLSLSLLLLVLASCTIPLSDEPKAEPAATPDEPITSTTSSALLQGEPCAPRACPVGSCGLIDDGCRAQMWCGECACPTAGFTCERSLTQIWEQPLFGPGTFTIVATTVIPATLDPVMHVIDDAGTEYAFDDNSAGGTLPRLTVTVPAGQQRLIVLRPNSDSPTGGSAVLQINGQGTLVGVKGRKHVFTSLRANEEIESVQLLGSSATHILYAMSGDDQHIQARVRGNGTAGGAIFTQASATSRRAFWLGTEAIQPQVARLIRNDRRLTSHDSDGDQLGYELEAAIGTCASRSGYATKDGTSFDCALASDARDTDGDGLADGLELRGLRGASPHVPLPRWGANPRHKDMFVEVDSAQQTAGETAPRMSAGQARMFSDIYGDRVRSLTPFEAALHAALLGNPDGKPGIAAHLDIGWPAQNGADVTVYGDWGGNSVVPPGPRGAADPQTAWLNHLAASRVALFRYSTIWTGSSGSTATDATCPGCGSYAWSSSNEYGYELTDTPAHESGHANAIVHSGPAAADAEIDPNCKPNWPSVENYGFAGEMTSFADGLGARSQNNARAVEWQAVSPSRPDLIAILRSGFGYRISEEGHVDWNRDGVFAPAGSTVRAYINYRPGTGCEFTRYNSQYLTSQMSTQRSPAMARLGDRLYLFSPGQSRLRVVSSTDSLDCPLSKSACGSFGGYLTTALDATRGVDAARVTSADGSEALLVVAIDATGVANYQLVTRSVLGATTWSAPQWSALWSTTTGEPALETMPDGRALLTFRQNNGVIMYGVFQYNGGGGGAFMQGGDARMCGAGGATLLQRETSSPGLARVNFAGVGPRTWLLHHPPASAFAIKRYDPADLCFREAEAELDASALGWNVAGRPVGVWVDDAQNGLGGKLHIFAPDWNADPRFQHLTQLWSYANPRSGLRTIGLAAGFDSDWSYGYGMDAWHDPQDSNLRAVWAMSPELKGGDGRLNFFPRADGINDFPLLNYDDWSVLSWSICNNVVNPTGSVPSPIICRDRPPLPN